MGTGDMKYPQFLVGTAGVSTLQLKRATATCYLHRCHKLALHFAVSRLVDCLDLAAHALLAVDL